MFFYLQPATRNLQHVFRFLNPDFMFLDPRKHPDWDDLLLATPGYSFFHSSAWARVLAEAYGYTPFYFAIIEGGKFRALVPIMEVNSLLTGKRGVSLPFTDYCDPIIGDGLDFPDLFRQITEFGRKRGWRYIELRGGDGFFSTQHSALSNVSKDGSGPEPRTSNLEPGSSSLAPRSLNLVPVFARFLGHTLDLTKGEEALYAAQRDSTRRNIKKAEKEKVEVRIKTTPGAVGEFYRLNCMTRREHGLPPQPYHFFERV